jgi:hypothetical protein
VILIHGSVPRSHCLLGQATFVFFTDVHAGPLESINQRGVGPYFCHRGDEDRPDFGISRLRTTMVLRGPHDTISVLQSWEIRNRVQRSYGPAKTPRALAAERRSTRRLRPMRPEGESDHLQSKLMTGD